MYKVSLEKVAVSEDSKPELTYGQKQVGVSFNPSFSDDVDQLKALAAAFIDKANELRSVSQNAETTRHLSVAITEAKTAQMWAVGGVTWKE